MMRSKPGDRCSSGPDGRINRSSTEIAARGPASRGRPDRKTPVPVQRGRRPRHASAQGAVTASLAGSGRRGMPPTGGLAALILVWRSPARSAMRTEALPATALDITDPIPGESPSGFGGAPDKPAVYEV